MVSVSIRKPVKIAAGISPIEAVRFTPAQKDIRSRKKTIKLNPVSMGIANFKRDGKKTVAIVASLSLGGIILLVVSSIVLTRSPEARARLYFPDGDYKIYLQSEVPEEELMAAGNPLNEELKQEILSIDGVTDVIANRQTLHTTFKGDINQNTGNCDMLTDQNYAKVEAALTEGTMPTDSHSIVISGSIGVPLQLLSNRPDVRQAEMELAQAFYATNAARAAFYPNITLSGILGWTNNGGGVIVNPGQWLLNAIGSLTQPLFNRGVNIANLKIAKSRQEEAKLLFRQSLLNAGKEVNDALTAWQTAKSQIEINARQVETLCDAVRKTESLMRHSNTTYLEVLTAKQSLLEAEVQQLQTRFERIQSIIKLYHALGGGM